MRYIFAVLSVSSLLFLSSCDTDKIGGGVKTKEDAFASIHQKVEKIAPTFKENNVRANINLSKTNLLSILPDLDDYPIHISEMDTGTVEVVEIFTSSEKAGSGRDGFYIDMANQFNKLSKTTSNGKKAVIAIRKIASGLGAQYILSGKYMPDAFSPSNRLWNKMLNASNISTVTIAESTAPNTAGLVVKKSHLTLVVNDKGNLDISKLLTNISSGDFSMGYTNPYQSSTGLNFLLTLLDAFSQGDESQYLSPDVASALENLQAYIPFVAQNTLQMRDATLNSNVLDAFVMEYQSFVNAQGLSDYKFIPFGVRHDSPLYALPNADESEKEVLTLFAAFLTTRSADLEQYGFGKNKSYKSAYAIKDNAIIGSSQKLWKQRKSGGKPIAAIFVADVSGSMEGLRIKALKEALISSSDLINSKNAIGLVTYNDIVNIDLPIKKYDVQQKSLFIGAVERLGTGGKTATVDAVLVAMDRLIAFGDKNPKHKKVIFLLSDGERTAGTHYSAVKSALEMTGIPIHAIAYELDSEELKDMASLAEGAYIKSSTSSASYRIGNLLNSEM